MKINTSRKAGFTLVEIMIVVAIIGLLAAIAIPNFVRARQTSQTNACINNLRQIDGAKQQWALENNQPAGVTPTDANIAPFLGRDTTATTLAGAGVNCPIAGVYAINAVEVAPRCGSATAVGGTHAAILE
ncbi:MAG: prepilin-type N-terminal cleavage/methylation domain-containing protein [Verrucomicrobiota bacterium]